MAKTKVTPDKKQWLRLPVVSLGSEFLVMGHLMRRNILAYKAPTNQEGYDIICIHPDPKKSGRQIRVQVKSRYQSDGGWGFPIKAKHLDGFDFLVFVRLNIGNFAAKRKGKPSIDGRQDVEYYTLTRDFIKRNHKVEGKWEKVYLKNKDVEKYKNEKGFELIAKKLKVGYPDKNSELLIADT